MTAKRILCIGNAVLDQLFFLETLPSGPGKSFASRFLEAGGGPAATASVAVARLGHHARLWSRIGADPTGDRIVRELEGYGVDLAGLPRIPGVASALAAIAVDARGERMILGYLDPNLPQDAHWLPLDQVRDFDCVLADMRWPAGAEAVLRRAARHGIPRVLDADLSPTPEATRLLVPLASHAVFSTGGLRQCTGEADPATGLRAAAALAPGTEVCVTLGDKGCLWLENGAIRSLPAFAVPVADTTGAGDVFHGAFAVALAEGITGRDALRFASGAAALKCTQGGGRAGIPDRAALEAFLSGPGADR